MNVPRVLQFARERKTSSSSKPGSLAASIAATLLFRSTVVVEPRPGMKGMPTNGAAVGTAKLLEV